jgi:hypothetical protein
MNDYGADEGFEAGEESAAGATFAALSAADDFSSDVLAAADAL